MPFPNKATQFGQGIIDPAEAGRKGAQKHAWYTNRKYCNYSCKIFDSCPYSSLSKTKYNGKCALKEMPKKIQNRTLKALTGDEADFLEMTAEFLVDLGTKIELENNTEMRLKYFDRMIKFYEAAYGKKQIVQANVTQMTPDDIMNKINEVIENQKNRINITEETLESQEEMNDDDNNIDEGDS